MKRALLLFLFCVLLGSFVSKAEPLKTTQETDLRDQWMRYSSGGYELVPVDVRFDEKILYIEIDLHENPNSFFQASSTKEFSVFVNGKLFVSDTKHVELSIDSIATALGAPSLVFALYHPKGVNEKRMHTALLTKSNDQATGTQIIDRASTYFRDFVVLGVFIILVSLILIVGQNPKLAADYFSLRKLFAAPGSQDSLSDNRTTSSSNILFQTFCSVLGGFLLTILFTYLKDYYPIAAVFEHTTFWQVILVWLILSAIILAVFLIRQFIIYLFAYFFGIRELSVAHYFNFIRLLFWILGVSAAGISIYLIVHGQGVGVFENVYFLLGWALGFWVVLIFFKLSRRVSFSMFHLFSYLCATEIIPLIITIKVLYY